MLNERSDELVPLLFLDTTHEIVDHQAGHRTPSVYNIEKNVKIFINSSFPNISNLLLIILYWTKKSACSKISQTIPFFLVCACPIV